MTIIVDCFRRESTEVRPDVVSYLQKNPQLHGSVKKLLVKKEKIPKPSDAEAGTSFQ